MISNNLFRSFEIVSYEQDGNSVRALLMVSSVDSEFGCVVLNTQIQFNSQYIVQTVKESSGESYESLYDFRAQEMQYFISVIVPLFKPLNYGLQTSQK